MSATDSTIKPEWTVIGPYLRKLIATAERFGVDRCLLLKDLDIEEAALANDELRFPMALLVKAFELAAVRSGNDDIGLHFGMSLSPEDQGVLGYLASCTNNMVEALEVFMPIRRIMMHSGSTECLKTANFVAFTWTPLTPSFDQNRYFANAIFTNWVVTARSRCDAECTPTKVEFTTPEPKDKTLLRQIFGENILFGCDKNRIVFHREDAERPFKPAEGSWVITEVEQQRLMQQVESDLKHLPDSMLATALVEKHIMRLLPSGECSLKVIADQLHMTERTLQRRLKVDQTRFNELLKNVRKRWAMNYLAVSTMPVTDIALLLGYQETSAFTHAFRSWTKMSPAEYRRKIPEEENNIRQLTD